MDTNEFERAKSALNQSLQVAGPILAALQQASTVFDVMSNATVHKAALEGEVATLLDTVAAQTAKVKTLNAKIAAAEVKASDVEADAARRIREAEDAVAPKVRAAEDALSIQISMAQVEATSRLQEIAAAMTQANTEFDAFNRDLQARAIAAENACEVLEQKLTAMKASAQKFAAALSE
jgi:hypothetical protein